MSDAKIEIRYKWSFKEWFKYFIYNQLNHTTVTLLLSLLHSPLKTVNEFLHLLIKANLKEINPH